MCFEDIVAVFGRAFGLEWKDAKEGESDLCSSFGIIEQKLEQEDMDKALLSFVSAAALKDQYEESIKDRVE